MLPVSILVATSAMLSGIGGAALFTPIFLIVFPLLGPEYPLASAVAAIGVALLTQTFGFSSGVVGYYRKRLIDSRSTVPFLVVSVPVAIVGALFSREVEPDLLKGVYALLMLILSVILIRGHDPVERTASPVAAPPVTASKDPEVRTVTARDGTVYAFTAPRHGIGAAATAIGAFLTGMVSVGIGEVIMPQLVKRNRVPVPVAAATSVLIVVITGAVASVAQIPALIVEGGWRAVPWNLVAYMIPGVTIGGQIGPHLQGRVAHHTMVRSIGVLFAVIGIAMAWIVVRDLSP